jgi:hypothetical protein
VTRSDERHIVGVLSILGSHEVGGVQRFSHGYAAHTRSPEGAGTIPEPRAGREMILMQRIRIEKPKPRAPRELEPILPLDPRDPDVVRVKRGAVWRFADRRWAAS